MFQLCHLTFNFQNLPSFVIMVLFSRRTAHFPQCVASQDQPGCPVSVVIAKNEKLFGPSSFYFFTARESVGFFQHKLSKIIIAS